MAPRILQFAWGPNEPFWSTVDSRGLVSVEKETGNMLRVDRLDALGLPVAYPPIWETVPAECFAREAQRRLLLRQGHFRRGLEPAGKPFLKM